MIGTTMIGAGAECGLRPGCVEALPSKRRSGDGLSLPQRRRLCDAGYQPCMRIARARASTQKAVVNSAEPQERSFPKPL